MRIAIPRIETIAMPAASSLYSLYSKVNLSDTYAIDVPSDVNSDPEVLARFVFSRAPVWMKALMAVRDLSVARLGLKTAKGLKLPSDPFFCSRVGIFRIYEKTADEIVMGEDDKHLDFRVSVRYEPQNIAAKTSPRVVISTVVHCHNALGRSYLTLIAPIHRAVVPSFLRQAARTGWPRKSPASPDSISKPPSSAFNPKNS